MTFSQSNSGYDYSFSGWQPVAGQGASGGSDSYQSAQPRPMVSHPSGQLQYPDFIQSEASDLPYGDQSFQNWLAEPLVTQSFSQTDNQTADFEVNYKPALPPINTNNTMAFHTFTSPQTSSTDPQTGMYLSTPNNPRSSHPHIAMSPMSPNGQQLQTLQISVKPPGTLPYSISSASASPQEFNLPMSVSPSMSAFSHDFQDDGEAEMPRAHIDHWKNIPSQAIIRTGTTIFIPQPIYKPHTQADQERYIKLANLYEPIIFTIDDPYEWGISLDDALRQRSKYLTGKDDLMFENCGPSVSIRIQWPGYTPWSRQIPTKDFKNPKGPITKAKLAKNIAKCVSRFIDEKQGKRMEDDSDKRFRVGPHCIELKDLMLVSLHHISQGSWQPHLRLRRHIF